MKLTYSQVDSSSDLSFILTSPRKVEESKICSGLCGCEGLRNSTKLEEPNLLVCFTDTMVWTSEISGKAILQVTWPTFLKVSWKDHNTFKKVWESDWRWASKIYQTDVSRQYKSSHLKVHWLSCQIFKKVWALDWLVCDLGQSAYFSVCGDATDVEF